ncbi:DUF1048 domain-containing protein [Raineyella sp. LH-20]|uniref:DUF1048 domain-containing protein n=1 Tax=Raineyella sp. LH-20 TaxID=3081204 RepID=UPI002954C00C|nr:DUF1048 domain-containing protein [Raineyella sp. LH-20]WOP17432.1 DUF1048 domain-containing protein [Raineyella sp. LH-20]
MAPKWLELVTGSLEQKKQYKQLRTRMDALPAPYAAAAKALHRYFMSGAAGIPEDDSVVTMMRDFVELWERAAADGTPLRDIVGEDPVEFADLFAQAYLGKRWIDNERARLTRAIEALEQTDGGEQP